MATNKRQSAKKKDTEEQKRQQERREAEKMRLEKEKREREEQAALTKKREEEKQAAFDAKMEKVKKYKYTITILGALCFAFVAGLLYNVYCSNGHLFDDGIEYFYDKEDSWHAFNGRYVRIPVDSAFEWYAGTSIDDTGELVMSGKTASCMIWLDSDAFMSLTIDNEEDFEALNNIIEETAAFVDDQDSGELETESIYFEGQLKRPSSTDLAAYKKQFENLMADWGFTADDYYLYELTLDTTADRSTIKITTIVYIVLAALFLITVIVVAVKYHLYKKKNGIKIVRE
jgi:uncharacterized membrane protein